MNKLLGNAAQGFPAMLGVLWGITLYSATPRLWLPATVLVAAFFIMLLGKRVAGRSPLLGCSLIEVWVAGAVGIVALSTMLVIWLTLYSPSFIRGTAEEVKVVSGALVGAVTSYLALLWVKDVQESEGPFWAGTQLKAAIQKAFSDPLRKPANDTREWDAVWAERVRDGGPAGWGFRARWKRSYILGQYLRKKASNPPAGEAS